MLHDIKATEKSIAAGGRDSIKDEETGVSNPYDIKKTISPQELKAKLTKLQELVLKTNLPGKPVSVSPCLRGRAANTSPYCGAAHGASRCALDGRKK